MPLTESSVFNRVLVLCNCEGMNVGDIGAHQDETWLTSSSWVSQDETDTGKLAELQIMEDAIEDGTAELWYKDRSTWIRYEDIDDAYGLIHAMNRMRPKGGGDDAYRILPNLVKDSSYSEDSDTGRPDITLPLGLTTARRKPDGTTFDYPLENWNARLIGGTQISVELNLTTDDNVTDINAYDDVIGMLAWLESLRTTGSAVGDDIEDLDDLDDRTYQFDMGFGKATLDLEIVSQSSITGVTTPTGVYSFAGFSFNRVSGETDTIVIADVRQFIADATGSITVASDDTPESPPFDLREAIVDVSRIRFPDGKTLEPHGERLVLRQSSLGITPLDGSARRIVRYDDLATQRDREGNADRRCPRRSLRAQRRLKRPPRIPADPKPHALGKRRRGLRGAEPLLAERLLGLRPRRDRPADQPQARPGMRLRVERRKRRRRRRDHRDQTASPAAVVAARPISAELLQHAPLL